MFSVCICDMCRNTVCPYKDIITPYEQHQGDFLAAVLDSVAKSGHRGVIRDELVTELRGATHQKIDKTLRTLESRNMIRVEQHGKRFRIYKAVRQDDNERGEEAEPK